MKEVKSIFDTTNQYHKDGNYPMFCSHPVALLDMINSPYPEVFAFYEKQMAQNWKWDEVALGQDRIDMLTANKEYVDLMVDTLLYQWSIDSVASNTILPLFAPFISSPEVHMLFTEVTRMEVIHSLSYSHIVQQTMQNPREALNKAMSLQESITRGGKIVEVFDHLALVGGKIRAGLLSRDSAEAKDAVFLGMVNLYILEQISFMSSFAVTFAISELGIFQGIGKLVALIARDEHHVHAAADRIICQTMIKQMPDTYRAVKHNIEQMIDEAVQIELDWNKYLFTGRSCVGLTRQLLDDWVHFMAKDIYRTFNLEPKVLVEENPLPYMEYYLDLGSTQNAPQESDITDYLIGGVESTLGDEELDF